jgi:hypothetical protein
MNIQNPGRAVGVCMTPLNARMREKDSVATVPV